MVMNFSTFVCLKNILFMNIFWKISLGIEFVIDNAFLVSSSLTVVFQLVQFPRILLGSSPLVFWMYCVFLPLDAFVLLCLPCFKCFDYNARCRSSHHVARPLSLLKFFELQVYSFHHIGNTSGHYFSKIIIFSFSPLDSQVTCILGLYVIQCFPLAY